MNSIDEDLKIEHRTATPFLPCGRLILLSLLLAGCGSGGTVPTTVTTSVSSSTTTGPQTYFAAPMDGAAVSASSRLLATYTIDDTQKTFSESTHTAVGSQLNYSGSFNTLPRGLLQLQTTYNYGTYGTNNCSATPCANYPTPPLGGWAVELAGQAGGLFDLDQLPFTPLAATPNCPNIATPESFLFVTLPGELTTGSDSSFQWIPDFDAAYGSVDINTSGSTVLFSNIQQFTAAGSQLKNYSTLGGAPVAYTSISGACSPTFYGNTISVPGTLNVTGQQGTETAQVAATVGLGPSGLLVENNGSGVSFPTSVNPVTAFQPFMGAGSGAIGLPKSSSPISLSALGSAQYLGFFYSIANSLGNWSSTVASFGFPSAQPASCASVIDQTGTQDNPIFGGDFPSNDATRPGDAGAASFGNCNVSVYLNAQDSANNGLFPKATVTMSSTFTGLNAGTTFPAVAIAGTLQGKYAIFVIASNGQAIYLFQSN